MDDRGSWRLMNRTVQAHTNEQGTVFWAVLAVLLVTSLLFSSVVLYGAWHQSQNRLFLYRIQARYLAEAALAQAQAHLGSLDASELARGITISDSLPHNQRWSATVSPWGCYLRTLCTGSSHQTTYSIDALLGRGPSSAFNFSLRLFGPPYPLVVAGQTRIAGDVNVGPGGVTSGQYRGRERQDTILVAGRTVTDPPPQPIPFDWETLNRFTEWLDETRDQNSAQSDRTLIIDDAWEVASADSVIVVDAPVVISRARPLMSTRPLVLFATGPVTISGSTRIDGRWVIRSDRTITVKDAADLAGVVLWAPHIEISGRARFSGQAIADTLLEVRDQARTIFPALLWVAGQSGRSSKPALKLESTKWCEGVAGISAITGPWEWMLAAENSGQLLLDPQSGWRGYLYVNGKAVIRGIVAGSVNAELLVVEDPPTTYLNWLLDAKVSRPAWQGSTALPAIMNCSQRWEVAEYLETQDRDSKVESSSYNEAEP
jgi:hypothetical protein